MCLRLARPALSYRAIISLQKYIKNIMTICTCQFYNILHNMIDFTNCIKQSQQSPQSPLRLSITLTELLNSQLLNYWSLGMYIYYDCNVRCQHALNLMRSCTSLACHGEACIYWYMRSIVTFKTTQS